MKKSSFKLMRRDITSTDFCSVPLCSSSAKFSSMSFHAFPTDAEIRAKWVVNIRRVNFTITNRSRVCSRHFLKEDLIETPKGLRRLRKGALPVLFEWNGYKSHQHANLLDRRESPAANCTRQADGDMGGEGGAEDSRIEALTSRNKSLEVLGEHDYSKKPLSAGEELQAAQMELDRLEEESRELKSERFFLWRLQLEPDLIKFFTGFKDYNTLKVFFLALQPTAQTAWEWIHALKVNKTEENTGDAGCRAQHLCLFDQLFLFLCFVRRGFLPVEMSVQFHVSEATVQSTCLTWCHYLFFTLGTLPIWLSRQAVDELMPPFFKTTFPKTRVVLDLTEIHIQTATCSGNSSHHKGSTTLKSVVGIAPSGSVSFVSSVCAASVSDKDVIRESGVLNLLEPGDQVMAYRSLEIKDLLDVIGVNLVIPTFLGPKGQKLEETPSQQVGHLKIHIERSIGRIKEYQIFADVVPSALCASVNRLWTVCALLTNFQGPLL
ncbi:uncharacterized protein LOC119894426 [Micropterus salmoides]|uniref:uncharacterized protein LOC119894426 n=1 Tax=Micropterus salmoides TaxID=27706 RepID=UPI0018EE386F|nr:uncharacterized protein LOC119894426 [Micropterus salmoides]